MTDGKGIERYEKFLTLWKDADPGIAEVEMLRRGWLDTRNSHLGHYLPAIFIPCKKFLKKSSQNTVIGSNWNNRNSFIISKLS